MGTTQATSLEQEVMQLEQEIFEKQSKLSELKKQLLAREPVANYTFQGPNGQTVKLAGMFGDKNDLIVVHNMGRSCAYCTLWADEFNGVYNYINSRTAFAVVSPDTPEVQANFAQSRGWRFNLYSAPATGFTKDMGFLHEEHVMPGASTFFKQPDGQIVRVGKTFFGPGDPYCGVWHLFDLLADGPNEWQPNYH